MRNQTVIRLKFYVELAPWHSSQRCRHLNHISTTPFRLSSTICSPPRSHLHQTNTGNGTMPVDTAGPPGIISNQMYAAATNVVRTKVAATSASAYADKCSTPNLNAITPGPCSSSINNSIPSLSHLPVAQPTEEAGPGVMHNSVRPTRANTCKTATSLLVSRSGPEVACASYSSHICVKDYRPGHPNAPCSSASICRACRRAWAHAYRARSDHLNKQTHLAFERAVAAETATIKRGN